MGVHHQHNIVRNLKIAFLLNASFTIIEFIGGWWTNSIAILSDAFHDLGDTLIILIAIVLEKISNKPSNASFPYGYKRVSLFAGLLTYIVLMVGSVLIIIHAIPRLTVTPEVNAIGMMFLAVLGVVFNGAGIYALKKGHTHNERAVRLHLLEDVLGWAAVFIGSIAILAWEFYILDPILSILIALYILYNAYGNSKKVVVIFLQQSPPKLNFAQIKNQITALKGVQLLQEAKFWSMDGQRHIGTIKVLVAPELQPFEVMNIKSRIEELLLSHQVVNTTIEINTSEKVVSVQKQKN